MSKESKIMVAIVAVFAGILIGIFMLGNKSGTITTGSVVPNADKLVRSDSHKTDSGVVKVVEFGDYQCPACEAAYPITKQIMKDYAGKITFVWRNYPLPQHKNAEPAAEAAEAAAAQGKFWEMHDLLYDHQKDWQDMADPSDTFAGYAASLGLDGSKVKAAIAAKAYSSFIKADQADGNDVSIQGTPTFFVDGVQASSYDYNTLKGMIDKELTK